MSRKALLILLMLTVVMIFSACGKEPAEETGPLPPFTETSLKASNVAREGFAVASSSKDDEGFSNLFLNDGDLSHGFSTKWGRGNDTSAPHYVMVDLAGTYIVEGVKLYPLKGEEAGFPVDFDIFVSTDNENYTKVASVDGASAEQAKQGFTVGFDPVEASYVKLVTRTAGFGADGRGAYLALAEFEVTGRITTGSNMILNRDDIWLYRDPDTTQQLKVLYYRDGTQPKSRKKLRFFSADPSIARVNTKGLITPAAPGETVIYVYDNNSKDGTDVIARKAGAVFRYERHQGKGNVIRRMFREIDAKAYIIIDGDDTYPAANGPEMVDLVLKHGADMVIGDRLSSTYYVENKRPFHNFGNDLVRYFINRLFHTDIKDIMTGYRAFSYKFVKTFPVLSQGFEIETEMTIHAVDKNMQVENVTIDYRDRPAGSVSKLNTYIDGFKVLRTIMHLYRDYRPLDFFCLLAIVFTLLAVGLDIPVALTYLETGQVPRFPTLIVSGFIVVAALLSFFNGMLLSTLNNRDKRQFELKLIETCDSYERKLDREKSVGASGQLKIEESGIEN